MDNKKLCEACGSAGAVVPWSEHGDYTCFLCATMIRNSFEYDEISHLVAQPFLDLVGLTKGPTEVPSDRVNIEDTKLKDVRIALNASVSALARTIGWTPARWYMMEKQKTVTKVVWDKVIDALTKEAASKGVEITQFESLSKTFEANFQKHLFSGDGPKTWVFPAKITYFRMAFGIPLRHFIHEIGGAAVEPEVFYGLESIDRQAMKEAVILGNSEDWITVDGHTILNAAMLRQVVSPLGFKDWRPTGFPVEVSRHNITLLHHKFTLAFEYYRKQKPFADKFVMGLQDKYHG